MSTSKRFFSLLLFFFVASFAAASQVQPVLEFPESGMDDPARYKDYTTRFYRDSDRNAFQIYLNRESGRVVHLWADAANESVSFTVRDPSGQPAALQWCGGSAEVTKTNQARFVEYLLCASSPEIQIGHLLLGTMRLERDFQYFKKDLLPFDAEPFHEPELIKLIANLQKLPPDESARQLGLLRAETSEELQRRMGPERHVKGNSLSAEEISFDGKNHLWLELTSNSTNMQMEGNEISIRSEAGAPLQLKIKVGTDATALSPLDRTEIFNDAFLKFYTDMEKQSSGSSQAKVDFHWIDREVQGMELVCYREKLMAGLPNFATYFGRDTMMSALMFEPVWSISMMEHAISSVLRKLSPKGEASHEEALGGQAIRENADEYNKLIEQYLKQPDASLLSQAREILENLQRVRENYKMVDDDFQLPVLLGRYLTNPQIPAERKRAFLTSGLSEKGPSRLSLILKNFSYVVDVTHPYAEHPDPLHLVSFPPLENGHWMSASWRDSGAGYAGGRFAMDVNVIWVPESLEAISATLELLVTFGYPPEELQSLVNDGRRDAGGAGVLLLSYTRNPESLRSAIRIWHGSIQHFWVRLNREEVLRKAQSKIDWLPKQEQAYWRALLAKIEVPNKLVFLALSLDPNGNPIPVLNTDPATLLFLEDFTRKILENRAQPPDVDKLVNSFLLPYPVGSFVDNLGLLCANDTFASRQIWEKFQKDQYHSPRVVWGREVNLFTLGLVKQILQSYDSEGKLKNPHIAAYVSTLRNALGKTRDAVEASGLKHNELWSYQIQNGKLIPVRYGSSSDVQLWNLTDLSIQFFLKGISELQNPK